MEQTLTLINEFKNELKFVEDFKNGLYDEIFNIEPEYRYSFLCGRLEGFLEMELKYLESFLPTPEDDPKESPLGYNPYMD